MTALMDVRPPADYTPMRMGLVHGRGHRDIYTAAVSIAHNRASKITLLAREGHLETAGRFLADLNADVDDFLRRTRRYKSRPAGLEQLLLTAATPDYTA